MDKDAIRKTIEHLLIIQEKDRRMARYKKEQSDLPSMQRAIESTLQTKLDELEAAKAELKATRAAVRNQELEIEAERQQIRKLKEQQLQIKTNDEYKALNNQIAHVEQKVSAMEDCQLELMDKVDQSELKIQERERGCDEERLRAKEKGALIEKRQATLEADIAQLRSERESMISLIDEVWLKRYNVLMGNKKDFALVAMDKSNTCEGCHMNLQPQIAHNVRGEAGMVSCTFCGRMLYWPGEA